MICNNCSKENFQVFAQVKCYFTNEPLSVVKCNHCGLVYLNPRPDKNLGLSYFEKAYSNAEEFNSHSYYRDHEQIFIRNEKRFELIEKLQSPNNKILDFGAGQGHFVKTAIDHKWDAIGLELSVAAIKAAKENFDIDLMDSIQKLNINDFGIIALWDVIEHLEDPKSTLLELSKYLHKDGIFIIETSNIDSLDFALSKKKWSYWHVDHLFYFSKRTIEYLLNRLNFKLINPVLSEKLNQNTTAFSLAKYIPLFNPFNLFIAVKRRWLSKKYKDIARNSLMTVVAIRSNAGAH